MDDLGLEYWGGIGGTGGGVSDLGALEPLIKTDARRWREGVGVVEDDRGGGCGGCCCCWGRGGGSLTSSLFPWCVNVKKVADDHMCKKLKWNSTFVKKNWARFASRWGIIVNWRKKTRRRVSLRVKEKRNRGRRETRSVPVLRHGVMMAGKGSSPRWPYVKKWRDTWAYLEATDYWSVDSQPLPRSYPCPITAALVNRDSII